MAVKLIAENILNEGDFDSATEQEGEYIGQPKPSSTNTGDFRLLASGDISDFSYSGTTTGAGNVGGTTLIDDVLDAYGDDSFIGGTVTITSGACNGETQTISDFAQTTGTITVAAAFTAQIAIGVTFTLTVAFSSREFIVELIDSGDAGDATFKWSHDGGVVYLGRDSPNQANWLAETEITNNADRDFRAPITQAIDGELVVVYSSTADSKTYSVKSDDNGKGLSWGTPVEIDSTTDYWAYFLITLSSGRLYGYLWDKGPIYSDDNGTTWAVVDWTVAALTDAVVRPDGAIVAVSGSNEIVAYFSNDGGFSWSTSVTIASDANTQAAGSIELMENGNLICVYQSDEESVGDFEIKAKISADGGATWGSVIDVMDFGAVDLWSPRVIRDINGDLYCIATYYDLIGNKEIIFARSVDNGINWGAQTDLKVVGGVDLEYADIVVVNGHEMICTYCDVTNHDIDCVRRGIWETYSANACPCAIQGTEQKLICDVGLIWHGGQGQVGDDWTFEAEYEYAMSNLIEDSPSKPWRSEQDNISCNIVLDIGANERHLVDGVGFFNCNIRAFEFELDTTSTFTPDDSASVVFDVTTGTVDSVTGNAVQDTSLLANYDDHYFAKRYYLRMTSGTDDGVTWLIRDNTGNYIFLETTAATNIAPADTFVIFQKHMAAEVSTTTPYRYMQIDIAAQHTAEDYYQIGTMVAGKTITLSKAWGVGYGKDHHYDTAMLRTPHGGMIPVVGADRKRIFSLEWAAAETTLDEVMALLDYIEGKNIVLIPDSTDLRDCYLVKLISDLGLRNRIKDKFQMSLTLEEAL